MSHVSTTSSLASWFSIWHAAQSHLIGLRLPGAPPFPLRILAGCLPPGAQQLRHLTTSELFDRIVTDLNYKEYINDESEEGADRWENVEELERLAVEYSTRGLDEFLENIALVSDQDTIAEGNVPTLLTLHAAKGLEFGAVFIIGLDDGILPHSRSFDEPEGMEEERRLFYVGITRAKDKLYLIRAIQRGGRGAAEETYPSRFLDDVPADLLIGKSRTGRSIHGRPPETAWSLVFETSICFHYGDKIPRRDSCPPSDLGRGDRPRQPHPG